MPESELDKRKSLTRLKLRIMQVRFFSFEHSGVFENVAAGKWVYFTDFVSPWNQLQFDAEDEAIRASGSVRQKTFPAGLYFGEVGTEVRLAEQEGAARRGCEGLLLDIPLLHATPRDSSFRNSSIWKATHHAIPFFPDWKFGKNTFFDTEEPQ